MVAEAQREADDYVAAKRQRAEQHADQDVAAAEDEARGKVEKASGRADRAREEAEEAVARARAQMVDARRLADDAAAAAKEAAEEARQRADQLAEDANARAEEAEQRVADAERRSELVAEGGRALAKDAVNGSAELDEMTKAELLELADGMGLEVNGHQLKKELVSAIKRSSK